MAGNPTLPKENIDEVILRLLALEPNEVDELDYETYVSYLRELLVEINAGRKIDSGEAELIQKEFKRVRGKKGRFKIKKTKITASSLGLGGIRKQVKGTQQRLMLAPVGGVPTQAKETVEKVSKKGDGDLDILRRISNTLDSIVKTLTDINSQNKKRIEGERRDSESKRRIGKEKDLESKRFAGIKKALSSITKPFQSIWDRIVNFITNIILGRIILKLIDWFVDPDNKDKIQSLIRFVKDWWPALLGSYILFGTSFGRLVRGLTGMVGRFIFQIGKVAIPKLLRFVRSPLGAGALLFTAGATVPAMFPGTVNEQERKTEKAPATNAEKITALEKQKANLNPFEKLQGKGSEIDEQIEFLKTGKTKSYGFSGGGFANFGKMFGGAARGSGVGSMFGPMGSLIGAGTAGAEGSRLSSGFVSGPKGKDKVPAMLTDGEFVMSTGAVQKYGVETLEAMNAAGGGTNQPKIVGGKTYAYGGGRVGGSETTSENFGGVIKNIKDFIKYKIGFDVDKPETWGRSLASAFNKGPSDKSRTSSGGSTGRGFDFNAVQNFVTRDLPAAASNLANRGQRLFSKDLPSIASNLASRGQNFLTRDLPAAASNLANRGQRFITKDAPVILDKAQSYASKTYENLRDLPKTAGAKFFDTAKGLSSTKPYQDYSSLVGEKRTGALISLSDKLVRRLPEGPFRDMADKGVIPIPSGNATIMRNLTFMKAVLGPLGKPFRILSNKEVDRMRQQTIEKTMGKSGLIVDPKTGQVRMNWNQEDINKGAIGGGAYTDELGARGGSFNSILGRFTASTRGGGNVLYSDDRYNFNKTVGEYAQLAKEGLLKGSMSDATYFGASMLGRFAQDIGWLNERALGSEIKIGTVNRRTIDPKTGRPKTKAQLEADRRKYEVQLRRQERQRTNQKALEAKRPWWDKIGWFGGGSRVSKQEQRKRQEFQRRNPSVKLYDKPKPNTGQPYKSRFARPRNAGRTPVTPLPRPRTTTARPPTYRGGQRGSGSRPTSPSNPPKFSPTHRRGTTTTQATLGVRK